MNVLIIYNWFFSFLYVVFQNSAFLFLCFQFFFDRPRAQKLFSLFFSFRRGTFCTVFVVALPLALERVVCTLSSPRIEAPGTRARRSL